MALRVLQVTAWSASLYRFALPLMEALREQGFSVEALSPHDGFHQHVIDAGFQVHNWHMAHTVNPLVVWRARRQLCAFLARHKFDVIHSHCLFAGVAANDILCRHATLIYTPHGIFTHPRLPRPARLVTWYLEARARRAADWLICVSQHERERCLQPGLLPPERICVIPAPVDLQRFAVSDAERAALRERMRAKLAIGPEEQVVVSVARLTWDKGYGVIIDAAQRLAAQGRKVRFVAVGDGRHAEPIKAAVQAAGLSESFIFAGWQDDVLPWYCLADVAVLASFREGLPLAPLEAMAAGIPVVVSDLPGCLEEVEHERTGLVFPVGDAAALAAAIGRLLDDPDLRTRLSSAARQAAMKYDISATLPRQIELYRRIARERSTGAASV